MKTKVIITHGRYEKQVPGGVREYGPGDIMFMGEAELAANRNSVEILKDQTHIPETKVPFIKETVLVEHSDVPPPFPEPTSQSEPEPVKPSSKQPLKSTRPPLRKTATIPTKTEDGVLTTTLHELTKPTEKVRMFANKAEDKLWRLEDRKLILED